MVELTFPILSFLIFLPLVGGGVLLCINRARSEVLRWVALGVTVVECLASLVLLVAFTPGTPEMQFVEDTSWIRELNARYHLGIDGISLLLVLLTTLLTMAAVLASWRGVTTRVKEYLVCILMLETGMVGVFVALDLLLFYLFWETMLVPMYFLIGIWGGPRRVYAAVKFILYTMVGSVLMLVAILILYSQSASQLGQPTFDLIVLSELRVPFQLQLWLFAAFAVAFAIKVPLFPFHTWLPDAHVEAPTAGSVLLAGVLLKMGTYGFLRFCLPLFPDASVTFAPLVCVLALIGIVYGALVAWAQRDIKRLVAYSSVSHLGLVTLGICVFDLQAAQGAVLQMVNHGLSTGALFLLVGMLYERRHTRMMDDFGGLARSMPAFAVCFLIVVLSSLGLPGLNGFVGEFLVLLGAFKTHVVYASVAATGIVLSAIYLLGMYQRVMHGKLDKPENQTLRDLTRREVYVLLPILLLIFLIGLFPTPFLTLTEASTKRVIETVQTAAAQRGQGQFQNFFAVRGSRGNGVSRPEKTVSRSPHVAAGSCEAGIGKGVSS